MVATGNRPVLIRWTGIMATAFNLVDYRTVEPARRLRIVEPRAGVAVAPAAAPVAAMAATPEPEPSDDRKPMPPAWLVAPPFSGEPVVSVHEPQAAYRPAPANPAEGPYRTIREVPRGG